MTNMPQVSIAPGRTWSLWVANRSSWILRPGSKLRLFFMTDRGWLNVISPSKDLLERQPDAVFPVTRTIIERGADIPATDAFRAEYRLRTLKRETDAVWEQVDVMLTPTTGTHYLISEVEDYPVGLNTNLGHYTNFMNLLDLAACAVPAGTTAAGLPFGVTLFAPAFSDQALLGLAARWRGEVLTIVETERLPMVVCGAHMSGLPFNGQLTSLGGRFLRTARTTPDYRFYALPGGPPERPGLVRVEEPAGDGIEVEVWDLPKSAVGTFLAGIPAPLGIGRVQLDDGTAPPGFLCEAIAVHEATDITCAGRLAGLSRAAQSVAGSPGAFGRAAYGTHLLSGSTGRKGRSGPESRWARQADAHSGSAWPTCRGLRLEFRY